MRATPLTDQHSSLSLARIVGQPPRWLPPRPAARHGQFEGGASAAEAGAAAKAGTAANPAASTAGAAPAIRLSRIRNGQRVGPTHACGSHHHDHHDGGDNDGDSGGPSATTAPAAAIGHRAAVSQRRGAGRSPRCMRAHGALRHARATTAAMAAVCAPLVERAGEASADDPAADEQIQL